MYTLSLWNSLNGVWITRAGLKNRQTGQFPRAPKPEGLKGAVTGKILKLAKFSGAASMQLNYIFISYFTVIVIATQSTLS